MRFTPLLIILLVSCEFFRPKETITELPIAHANDQYLYGSDLDGLFPANVSAADSAKLAAKYIDDWVRKQMMISKSTQFIDLNEAEIERKVLDYRYALIVHSYIKGYIDENLNEEVSDEEINKYYEEKSDNFLLKQSIVKCSFVQVPKTAARISTFRRDWRSYPTDNVDEVKSYISQFASKSYIEDSSWVFFDDVIYGTPLETLTNKDQFLSRTKSSETSNDTHIFFLKIFDFKASNEISPLEFIREDIVNIIINKRKIALQKELEEKIYEEAKQQGLFEVFDR
ncbi:peptidyl-prolyl cis-trans isomerase [Marinoscillum sp. MHG1-6]|uniref:peptidyl-prolyl cis-trans isomerase n=1 Tax=Marinoscillum sp. MHG1-6 TaxID=2959627 RepID=UPI0021585E52|nr:peptidyl-prolyl cis-trans isomerase [Marinoscillum sp. MHG1-6]